MRSHLLATCLALGAAQVYRDTETGELIVDTDTLERVPRGARGAALHDFAGEYGDADLDDDDDFGDDIGDDFGDDVGDDLGDASLDDDDDFGDRDERRARRAGRRARRHARHHGHGRKKRMWSETAVAGSATLTGAGVATATIRLQHDFISRDILFDGTLAGTMINQVRFGDRLVFDSSTGIPFSVFSSTGFVRGFLKGSKLRGGLDIQITGTLTGAGTLSATVVGKKPSTRC